ncbi:MAG: alkaline phosphatase family protein [Prolixibacteraceae bacterium]|nr:alkaline phosphatase family protein [Prolixibacteraceae bacterium]
MKKIVVVLLIFSYMQVVSAQNDRYHAQKPPKVVIGILVENMRPDYVDRYWSKFGDEGFRKLYQNGVVAANVKMALHTQNYASGTATLFSGVYPSEHGIIDENWFDRPKGVETGCITDDNFFTVGADSKTGNASPNKLMAYTVADNLKLHTMGKAKIFSVAMNPQSAIFAAGHAADAAWWFDQESGRMISSSYYVNTFPEWARDFNMVSQGEKYSGRNWALLHPENYYTESLPDNHPSEKGFADDSNMFPHALSKLVKAANSFNPVKATPFANTIVKEFALKLLEKEDVGNDDIPDLVTVVFSSMDYEYGLFGPASVEMQDLYLRLDEDIAELINFAERKYGKPNVAFFLTANTSASYPVSYMKEDFRLPVGDFMVEGAFALLNSYLNLNFGEAKWIEHLSGQQVYLNHKLIEKNNVNPEEISSKVAEFLVQFEGVKAAFPAHVLERDGLGNNPALAGINRSYMSGRSGDVLYVLNEGWQPAFKFKRVNYTDQTHIPMVFYGSGIKAAVVKNAHDAVDFAPTLSELLQIPAPDRSRGVKIFF